MQKLEDESELKEMEKALSEITFDSIASAQIFELNPVLKMLLFYCKN